MARRAILLVVAVLGCAHSQPPPQPPTEHSPQAVALPSNTSQTGWRVPASAYRGERNRCIDRELQARDLNEFGDPPGSTYPEGHPLGVTGTNDRFDYVLQRNPAIRTTCTQTGFEPER
jgi:hypothetical protein